MKRMVCGIIFVWGVLGVGAVFAAENRLIDDFDTGNALNRLGLNTGCFSMHPNDREQYCTKEYVPNSDFGRDGYSLRLEYDIDTPNTYYPEYPNRSFNGYFSLLKPRRVAGFRYLSFDVKGDKRFGYPRNITVQLRTKNQTGSYVVENLHDTWQRFVVPLEEFDGLTEYDAITEFIVVFNEQIRRTNGAIFLDNIAFTNHREEKTIKVAHVKEDFASRIVPDGKLFEWDGVEPTMLNGTEHVHAGKMQHPERYENNFYLMWDESYLYFAAEVFDYEVVSLAIGSEIKQEDHIELILNATGGSTGRDMVGVRRVFFSPSGPEGVPQVWDDVAKVVPYAEEVKCGARIDSRDGKKRYVIEAALSWEYLGVVPKKGLTIGFTPVFYNYNKSDYTAGSTEWQYVAEGSRVLLGKLQLR